MVGEDAETMKYVLIFLVLLAAGMSIPPVRAKLEPVLHPVFEKIAPLTTRIKMPYVKWRARNDAQSILQKLVDDQMQGKPIPSELTFRAWVRQNIHSDSKGVDPWGSDFYYEKVPHEFKVGSRGPDGVRGNNDDVIVTAPY